MVTVGCPAQAIVNAALRLLSSGAMKAGVGTMRK